MALVAQKQQQYGRMDRSASPQGQDEKQKLKKKKEDEEEEEEEENNNMKEVEKEEKKEEKKKEEEKEEEKKKKKKKQRVIPEVPDKKILDAVNTESLQQLLERVSNSSYVKQHKCQKLFLFIIVVVYYLF